MKKFISAFMTLAMVMTMGSVFASGITITEPVALNGILGKILGIVKVIAVAFATGMLLYVSSNLKYGRTPSKIVKDTKTEEYDDIVEKKSFFKRIIDKVKSWFVLFKD